MTTFVFTKYAEKRLHKLGQAEQQRILIILKELKAYPDIVSVLKPLHNFDPATHRLRVGNYRLILQLTVRTQKSTELLVLDVGHRRDIYRS